MSYQKVYMNQIYSSSIMRQVAQMWKNQLLCDAVIKTGNVHTKAHRLVLIAACPMLQDTENASVGSHLEVRLNSDISESSVKIFLQYLYEGYMMLTEENCRDVEKIAKMLHVDSITKCCTDFQKCLNAKMGYSSSQKLNFDLQDSADFRFVNTTDLQKTVPEGQQKRQNEMISGNTASKRPRFQSSSYTSHRPDDHLSMNDSYNSVRNSNQKEKEGIIDISEQSVELINIGPGARDSDGWPINTDLPPIRTSSSVSVANQQERETDVQIVNVQPARVDRAPPQPSQQGSTSTFGRHQDPRSSTIVAGQSQGIPERLSIVPSHSPKSSRRPDESPQYMSSNIPQLSPLSSTSPKSVQKHRETDDHDRPFALGSAPTGSRSFSLPSSSTIHPVDVVKNTSLYESEKFTTDNTNQNSMTMETGNKRTSASPEPIIVKLEDDNTESGDIELYIQNPQNDSFSTDPGDPGGESQSELDPDMSNDGSMSMEPGPWQQQEGQTQDPVKSFMKKTAVGNNDNCSNESSRRKANISGVKKLTTQVNILRKDMSKLCESSFSIQYMVEELVESSNTIEKLLINMTPGLDIDEEVEETGTNGTSGEGGTSRNSESSHESDPVIFQKKSMSNTDKFFAMAADSAKTQSKSRRRDDFSDIPKSYRISKVALEEMKANSKNAGVFAGNVIKMLFPELFGPSNLRFKYSFFGGGILKKNELDRQRKSYMRRYVTTMYPGIFSEGDWKDIVNKVNEMLRRPAHTSRKNVKSEMEENNDN